MTHISMHMIVRQDLEIARLRKVLAVAREALQFIADWDDDWVTGYVPVAVLAVARGALDKTEGGETTGNEREGTMGSPDARSVLLPAEHIALTVAQAQLRRGENPPINITTALVLTIERLAPSVKTERGR